MYVTTLYWITSIAALLVFTIDRSCLGVVGCRLSIGFVLMNCACQHRCVMQRLLSRENSEDFLATRIRD